MSTPTRVTHIIDDREPLTLAAWVGAELGPYYGAVSTRLKYGDYLVLPPAGGVWAVERKEANDLISSIASGRGKKQLRGCLDTYDRVFLLIEGILDPTPEGYLLANGRFRKMHRRSLAAWLRARKEDGVEVLWAPTATLSAHTIAHLLERKTNERRVATPA